ncbi:hypothetical protein L195_g060202, partial [Trifolium pratense]
QVRNLRKLLSKWKLDVQSAAALFKGERDGRKIGDAKYSDLEDQFEGLKQHCSDLEASNIELVVQYETVKQLLVIELHAELNDVKQSSKETASVIGSQLENLQKEVTERAMLLEQGWNTTISDIV